MEQFKNIITQQLKRGIRTVTFSTLHDETVVKYFKISFVGDEKDLKYGIGNLWIEAYEYDYMNKRLRNKIIFESNGDDVQDMMFDYLKSDLGDTIIDITDLDYESDYTMKATTLSNNRSALEFDSKSEYPDASKIEIKVDYQICDEKIYNALIEFYKDLETIAIVKEEEKVKSLKAVNM